MLKKFTLFTLCFIAIPCFAIEDTSLITSQKEILQKRLTGTFGVTNNYLSEGISNTNNGPAIQGNLNYTFPTTGIYFNAFGSNVDFINPQFKHAAVELDMAFGIANPINNDWSYNIYIDHYSYPGASGANYTDLITNLTFKAFTASAYYSANVYGSHDAGIYLNGTLNYEIPKEYISFSNISALASFGHYQLPKATGIKSYYNYMLGIQKIIHAFTYILQWSNTSDANFHPYDGNHILGTVLFTF